MDPLAEVVAMLQPAARLLKPVNGAGRWRIRRTETGEPFYCAVLSGACRLSVDGAIVTLRAGDFVLIPSARDFDVMSLDAASDLASTPVLQKSGGVRVGSRTDPVDVRLLVGHCTFGSPDAALLASLLPRWVHVQAERRLVALVQLLQDECRSRRPARDVILTRLLEVLLIETLRSTANAAASPGLLRGLADARIAQALRHLHAHPQRAWTMATLADAAALSRSSFFERFNRTVGTTPMAYLLAWRMALARELLQRHPVTIAEVAERVGYSSASTFSVAFARHTGLAPARYAQQLRRRRQSTATHAGQA